MRHRNLGFLLLFGATFGAFLDALHTHGGAITYPEGTNHYRGILTFAVVYPLACLAYVHVRCLGSNSDAFVSYRTSAASVAVYGALYALTAYSTMPSVWIAAILFSAAVFFWVVFDRCSLMGLVGAVLVGVVGAFVEHTLSQHGTMQYAVQDIGMVPLWLPGIYALATTTVGQMARRALHPLGGVPRRARTAVG